MCLKSNLKVELYQALSGFTDSKEKVKQKLDYIKSDNTAKIVSIKESKNCIEIVSQKLDVTENDLCKNCKRVLTKPQCII